MLKGLFGKLGRKRSKGTQQDSSLSLTRSIEDNIERLKKIFRDDDTFITRRFLNNSRKDLAFCICFIQGMIDTNSINECVIKPIQEQTLSEDISDKNIMAELTEKIIDASNIQRTDDGERILESLLYGSTILLVDGISQVLIIDSKGWEKRAISEPDSEKVVRGPREGFIECMISNLSMIRRKIQSPNLKFVFKKLGEQTKTRICVCYIEGLASEQILQEVYTRLDKIKIDAILDSGYIQEIIKDAPYSPFDTIGSTERPDTAAAKLLEGRVAIIVDGSPFVLTLPYLFMEYFQVNEDYYSNFIFSSFNRILRIVGAGLTVMVPALYIAVTTYHHELLPTPLLLSIAAARQGIPFPTVVEAILMILTFEILREAGTRIPTPIGQAISIVGALVLGQAAVDARIVSAPIVIVTALTGITSLLSIKLLGAPILIRFIFLFLASFMGLFGLIFGFLGLVIHLSSLRSFGIPFTLNIGSLKGQDFKDTAIRAPWWFMALRPELLSEKNRERQPKQARKRKNAQ